MSDIRTNALKKRIQRFENDILVLEDNNNEILDEMLYLPSLSLRRIELRFVFLDNSFAIYRFKEHVEDLKRQIFKIVEE